MLIYKDEKKIKQATDFLESSIKFLNAIYYKFTAIGIILTLNQLAEIVNTLTLPDTSSEWLEVFLLSLGYTEDEVNAIALIKTTIHGFIPATIALYRIEPNLLVMQFGKIAVHPGSASIIERRFSFNTNNERGVELASKLSGLAKALNDCAKYIGMLNEIPKGIEVANFEYRPDISFIRSYELQTPAPIRDRAYQ